MISLDAYAATVARTTTREATNTATMNQLQYEGYDLVKMSKHNSPCPVCSVYEGRVYSISGKNPNYPALSIVFHSGHAVIHPNCRHVLAPYIVSLADDPDGDRRFSNRPFNVDDRSKKAIEAYNQRQAEQRRIRADRLQFQRHKIVLGEEAPKTLGGFRRMKKANSERWNELQTDYRDALKPEDKAESFDTNGKKFAEMRAEEDKLRPLKKEVGIVYNTSGQEVWRQSGEMATVDISGAQSKGVLEGNILTHNHPRGTSFSDTDIYVMAQNDMSAIRAVTKNHTYEARLSEDFKQVEPFERARMLKEKVKEYEAEVKKELSMPINGKEISLQTATLELWHRVWERIAGTEKWIIYSRKANK
jgi:predicted nucleotidyltransferase